MAGECFGGSLKQERNWTWGGAMRIANWMLPVLSLVGLAALGGCASHAPTIAHTHIGHALTGWPDTPHQEGLFVAAQQYGKAALKSAREADSADDLATIKSDVAQVVKATSPDNAGEIAPDGHKVYGVKNALTLAVRHIQFAGDSPDASANVRSSAKQFAKDAVPVLDRCDLIKALGINILNSPSKEEAKPLSRELLRLARANVDGDDSNGDGVVGSVPSEYGLKQLRAELQAMIDREDPPYTTVDTWYLFNLIRLPSGQWIFRQRSSDSGSYGGY